jgi:5-methylcytosine-specific restriction endonuclease McrA
MCVQCIRENNRRSKIKTKAANPEAWRVAAREYHARRADIWQKADKRWRLNGGQAVKTRLQRERRARIHSATGTHDKNDIIAIYKAQSAKCAYCQKSIERAYEVDHIIPLSRGGTNDRTNIQLVCRHCNRMKYNHDPLLFARRLGKLL